MTNPDGLLAALTSIPRLDGAACRNRWTLFCEPETADDVQDAIDLCLYACPALDACKAWYASLPPRQRPTDCVTAGAYRPAPRQRNRAA